MRGFGDHPGWNTRNTRMKLIWLAWRIAGQGKPANRLLAGFLNHSRLAIHTPSFRFRRYPLYNDITGGSLEIENC
jgi:hypothetical protein